MYDGLCKSESTMGRSDLIADGINLSQWPETRERTTGLASLLEAKLSKKHSVHQE